MPQWKRVHSFDSRTASSANTKDCACHKASGSLIGIQPKTGASEVWRSRHCPFSKPGDAGSIPARTTLNSS
eukprot:scaffold50990_cov42-Prasinocladus_malaysianus.AAC.1